MQIHSPDFIQLFDQLGLSSREQDIVQFIAEHRPLPEDTKLAEASFWSESQSRFLKEALAADADWALPIDQLDTRLRAS